MSRIFAERHFPRLPWLLGGTALLVWGCQKAPSDLREWTPKDHTNTGNKAAEPNGQVSAAPAASETPPRGLDAVTLATWGTQCSTCHGKIGKGDGPTGRMMKAADLSNPTWQAQVSDDQIRSSIVAGKNAMPAFSTLPPETVENLVWLVRWFNSDQKAIQARMDLLKSKSTAQPVATTPGSAAPSSVGHPTETAAPRPAAEQKPTPLPARK